MKTYASIKRGDGVEKDQSKVAGGIARAQSLTKEERSGLAKRAASVRWGNGAMRATHMGELIIGNMTIPCAVLEDGGRILSLNRIIETLGRRPSGREYRQYKDSDGSGKLPVFLSISVLKPFISNDLADAASRIIEYRPVGGGPIVSGLPATILPQICEAWLDARSAGVLTTKSNLAAAMKAEMLLRSFARVGIIALVDEATGYQEIRDRHALQAILDKFLRKELATWAKQFPDEFYQQIFRLREWQWRGMKINRPQCVANYTKNIVYERLAPGILDEIERRNPVESGRRKAKHHQWLTSDVGHPALSQHLHAVIGLMRISNDWTEFKHHLDRAFPRKGETLEMLID